MFHDEKKMGDENDSVHALLSMALTGCQIGNKDIVVSGTLSGDECLHWTSLHHTKRAKGISGKLSEYLWNSIYD